MTVSRLNAGQRHVLELLAAGPARLIHGSTASLLRRELIRSDGSKPHPLYVITLAGRVAVGDPLYIRAAGTLDLTVHRRDPAVPAKMRPAAGQGSRYRALTEQPDNRLEEPQLAVREWEGHAGATICGRKLRLEQLWVDHRPEPGEPFCPGCCPGVDDDPDDWSVTDFDPDDYVPGRSVEDVKVAGGVL